MTGATKPGAGMTLPFNPLEPGRPEFMRFSALHALLLNQAAIHRANVEREARRLGLLK
jgi:hypothetical protein